MKSRPVLITFSILAGLQVLTGGAVLTDVIGEKFAGFFILVVSAVQVGMTFYVQNLTVPYRDAVAFVDGQGDVVAGPAAPLTNGTPVDVVQAVPNTGGGL